MRAERGATGERTLTLRQPFTKADAAELEQSLFDFWDAQIVAYDLERFPIDSWILTEIRNLGFDAGDLTMLHESVPQAEVYPLTKALCQATRGDDFQRRIREFVVEEIVPKGQLQAPLAIQRALNVRIMLPDSPHAVFPFHTGLLYGHGRAARSLWLPLTDVSAKAHESASLQMIGIERSRILVEHALQQRMSIVEMNASFGKECSAIRAKAGEVVLFSQENLHGNFVNRTGKTRVSIDFRLAEARFGDHLARKTVGGYFDVISDTRRTPTYATNLDALQASTKNVAYLNNNSSRMDGTPAHLQRYMMQEYSQQHDFACAFELFELETMNHLPTLHHTLSELRCNVVLYSVFSLPEQTADRLAIFEAAAENDVVLCFVNEDLLVRTPEDRQQVEDLFEFVNLSPIDLDPAS